MIKEQKEILIAQVFALRAQCDATLAVLGVQVVDESPEECEHPIDQRENLTTMGGPDEWRCRACGHHYSANKDGG
jgi:ubiquitin C-terminal hydrolase